MVNKVGETLDRLKGYKMFHFIFYFAWGQIIKFIKRHIYE